MPIFGLGISCLSRPSLFADLSQISLHGTRGNRLTQYSASPSAMSTNSEESQGTPAPEHDFDELTGVYGFFRKHQKKLLYTAGLFTLLTFSITGSVNGWVQSMFSKDRDRASIVVNGARVQLSSEDYVVGGRVARFQQAMPFGSILPVLAGEGGDTELSEVFAIMRCVARTQGFEPSFVEVDRAIEAAREQQQAESAARVEMETVAS